MPIEKKYELVILLLLENIRDLIEVETFDALEEIDQMVSLMVNTNLIIIQLKL